MYVLEERRLEKELVYSYSVNNTPQNKAMFQICGYVIKIKFNQKRKNVDFCFLILYILFKKDESFKH